MRQGRKNNNKFGDMALDGEESTPVPNLALEAIVKPAIREVMYLYTKVILHVAVASSVEFNFYNHCQKVEPFL